MTSNRPMLRWELAPGMTGAHVEICADPGCETVLVSFDAIGDEGRPEADLPVGVAFWRLRGRDADTTLDVQSPTWWFAVGTRVGAVDTSWGRGVLEANGDGYADLLHDGSIYAGAETGPSRPLGVAPLGDWHVPAGDVNGDGYGDVAGRHGVYFGGADGPASVAGVTYDGLTGHDDLSPYAVSDGSWSHWRGVGDLDGNGLDDLSVLEWLGTDIGAACHVLLAQPAPAGGPPVSFRAESFMGCGTPLSVAPRCCIGVGDVDGDGYDDLFAHGLRRGGAETMLTPSGAPYLGSGGFGDVDGDGRSDALYWEYMTVFATLSSATASETSLATLGAAVRGVAAVGDMTGDGRTDVVVDLGHVRFMLPGGVPAGAPHEIPSIDGALGPYVVEPLGDVDGDGYADIYLAAGATTAAVVLGGPGELHAMRVELEAGPRCGLPSTPCCPGPTPCGPGLTCLSLGTCE